MADTVELVVKLLGDGAQLAAAFDALQKKVTTVATTVAKIAKEASSAEKAALADVVAAVKKAEQDEQDARLKGLAEELQAIDKAKAAELAAADAATKGAEHADAAMVKAYTHAYQTLEKAAIEADRKVETAGRNLAAAEQRLAQARVTAAKSVGTAYEQEANKAVAIAQSEVNRRKAILDRTSADAVAAARKVTEVRAAEAKKAADAEEREAKRGAETFKKAWADAGNVMKGIAIGAAAVSAATLGPLTLATKASMDFHKSMAGVFALLSSDQMKNPKTMQDLENAAISVSEQYGITKDSVAEALRVALGSGIELETLLANNGQFLASSAKAAVSGMTDIKDVVKLTASVMNSYGTKTMPDAIRIQNVLAKAVNLGTVEWKDFNQGLGQVLPFAQRLGLGIEDVAAMVVELTNKGVPAEQAMSAIKAMMQGMLEPQKDAADMFETLGIKLNDSTGKARPFLDVMREVRTKLAEKGKINLVDDKAMEKATKHVQSLAKQIADLEKEVPKTAKGWTSHNEQLAKLKLKLADAKKDVQSIGNTVTDVKDKDGTVATLFGDVNAKAVAVILAKDGMGGLEKAITGVSDSSTALNDQFAGFTKNNPAQTFAEFEQTFDTLKIAVGDAVVAVFGPLGKDLEKIVKGFTEWARANPDIIRGVVMFLGVVGTLAAVLSPVAGLGWTITQIVSGFKTLSGVWTLMGGLGGGVTQAFRLVGVAATGLAGFVGTAATAFWGLATAAWAAVAPFLPIILLVTAIAVAAYLIYKNWDSILPWLKYFWFEVKAAWEAAYEGIKTGVLAVVDWIVARWDEAVAAVSGFFSGLGQDIADAWETAKTGATEFATWFASAVSDAITSAVSWITDKLKGFWQGIKDAAAATKDFVLGSGGDGGGAAAAPAGAGTPPGYAAGGIVTRRTLAYVGEAGPEAIIPLSSGGVPVHFLQGPSDNVAATGAATAGRGGDTYNFGNIVLPQSENPRKMVDDFMREIARRKGIA